MVKVLSCHHFASQEVFSTVHEPLAICATQDHVFIATSQCYIEVHTLKGTGCPRIHRFPTVATVKQLAYSKQDDYLATLEEKPARKASQGCVRVYLHWQEDISQQPMRARVAGHMTSMRQVDEDGPVRLEVVEIPLKQSATCIGTDSLTGNLVIAVGSSILVYGHCMKTVASTKSSYLDFKCLLEMEVSFKVKEISMCEEFIACGSDDLVQVFRLKVADATESTTQQAAHGSCKKSNSGTKLESLELSAELSSDCEQVKQLADAEFLRNFKRSWTSPSPSQSSVDRFSEKSTASCGQDYIVEDESHIVWNWQPESGISSMVDSEHEQVRTILLRSVQKYEERKSQKQKLGPHEEIVGPVDEPAEYPASVEFEGQCSEDFTGGGLLDQGLTTLLVRRFSSLDIIIHSLQFVPVYLNVYSTDEIVDGDECRCSRIFQSKFRRRLVGLYCFFSGHREGYIYSVLDKPHILATIPYTSFTKQVTATSSLLYAITNTGMEIYTSRCLLDSLHNVSSFEHETNPLPPASLETCLIGVQAFIGITDMSLGNQDVVLLSKQMATNLRLEDDNWSLYALKCPTTADLYRDMVELAARFYPASPPTYHQLLQEAHALLRGQELQDDKLKVDEQHSQRRQESALKLAQYYSRQDSEDTTLTLPYLTLSAMSVDEVIGHYKLVNQENKQGVEYKFGPGLMHYLEHVLFDGDESLTVEQETGDVILDIYANEAPHKLSTVILTSRLKSYSNDHAQSVLQVWMNTRSTDRQKSSTKNLDTLALAVLQLRLCEPEDAEATLFALSKGVLVNTCVLHHQLLHNNFTQFSHLAQLLRRHKPSVFIQILVALNDAAVMTMDATVQLLQCDDVALYDNTHVRQYLETLLNNKTRAHLFPDAAVSLCQVYLERLRRWTPPQNRAASAVTYSDVVPRGSGHFGKRFSWLDNLPPFKGPKSLRKQCLYAVQQKGNQSSSPVVTSQPMKIAGGVKCEPVISEQETCWCCSCNADLLKLQSLLCSKFTSADLTNQVLSAVEGDHTLRGRESLHILCLGRVRPRASIDLILEKFPEVLPAFAVQTFGTEYDLWSYIMECIINVLRQNHQQNGDNGKPHKYEQAFQCILAEMAEILSPSDFLNLLPYDGNTSFFLPFVERCCKKNQANQLRELIISKGKALRQA